MSQYMCVYIVQVSSAISQPVSQSENQSVSLQVVGRTLQYDNRFSIGYITELLSNHGHRRIGGTKVSQSAFDRQPLYSTYQVYSVQALGLGLCILGCPVSGKTASALHTAGTSSRYRLRFGDSGCSNWHDMHWMVQIKYTCMYMWAGCSMPNLRKPAYKFQCARHNSKRRHRKGHESMLR